MTESVATQFLRPISEESSTDKETKTYTPKTTFSLEDCWFINSLTTKKISLFNKNIARDCKVAVVVNGKELSSITDSKEEIFGKWDYLLVTIFGIKYSIRRYMTNTAKDIEDISIDNRIKREYKFIIKKESDPNFRYEIRRFYLTDAEEKLPQNYKLIKTKDDAPKYMQIDTGEITLCTVQDKKNPSTAEKKDILESLSCKTAFMFIISHALRLKLNSFLDETTVDLFNDQSSPESPKKGVLSKIINEYKKAKTDFSGLYKNKEKLQKIQEFKIKYLTQNPINIERAYTVINVWENIESTFFLKERMKELENKLDSLADINRTDFEMFLQKYGLYLALSALALTGVSALNDVIELISKIFELF